MIFFRTIVLGVLLIAPIVSNASTVTSLDSSVNGSVATPVSFSLTAGTTDVSVVKVETGAVNDVWSLTVGANEKASINFTSLDNGVSIGNLTIDALKISNFTITPQGAYSLTDLGVGSYSFNVTGNATGVAGGLYSVATSVSAVPVPAAIWMMGSALVGLVSFSRRRNGLSA